MSLDLSCEELLRDEEILSSLGIGQEELNGLEGQGLQFIKIGDSHFYFSSTLSSFLKGIEGKAEKRSRSKKNIEGEAPMIQAEELSGE